MKLINRAAWGAKYGRGPTNITPQNGGVAVHYVGAGKLATIDHDRCAARVRGIEADHVNGNGWQGIAYNFLVCHHGYVFEGRGLGRRSAAQGTNSGNQNWYAVCALVGAGDATLPDELLTAVRDAIDYMQSRGAGKKIRGHRDFHSTSCPGGPLYAWVKAGAPRPGGGEPEPVPQPPKPGTTAPKAPGRVITQPPVMTGADVRTWQTQMAKRGWQIEEDGAYGPASEKVCRAFQDEKGLRIDGKVGAITWRATWETPVT